MSASQTVYYLSKLSISDILSYVALSESTSLLPQSSNKGANSAQDLEALAHYFEYCPEPHNSLFEVDTVLSTILSIIFLRWCIPPYIWSHEHSLQLLSNKCFKISIVLEYYTNKPKRHLRCDWLLLLQS